MVIFQTIKQNKEIKNFKAKVEKLLEEQSNLIKKVLGHCLCGNRSARKVDPFFCAVRLFMLLFLTRSCRAFLFLKACLADFPPLFVAVTTACGRTRQY